MFFRYGTSIIGPYAQSKLEILMVRVSRIRIVIPVASEHDLYAPVIWDVELLECDTHSLTAGIEVVRMSAFVVVVVVDHTFSPVVTSIFEHTVFVEDPAYVQAGRKQNRGVGGFGYEIARDEVERLTSKCSNAILCHVRG